MIVVEKWQNSYSLQWHDVMSKHCTVAVSTLDARLQS